MPQQWQAQDDDDDDEEAPGRRETDGEELSRLASSRAPPQLNSSLRFADTSADKGNMTPVKKLPIRRLISHFPHLSHACVDAIPGEEITRACVDTISLRRRTQRFRTVFPGSGHLSRNQGLTHHHV
jgi:hypothetical protein